MMARSLSILLGASLLVAAWANAAEAPPPPAPPPPVVKARAVAADLTDTLRAKLMSVMAKGGPVAAIEFCATEAPRLSIEVGRKHGCVARRTSLRLRNPKNAPDAWETKTLETLAAAAKGGKLPEEIHEESREKGKVVLRFAKPIVFAGACSSCHGAPESIPPELGAAIEKHYPEDRATGFATGDLRGIVSVIVPLE